LAIAARCALDWMWIISILHLVECACGGRAPARVAAVGSFPVSSDTKTLSRSSTAYKWNWGYKFQGFEQKLRIFERPDRSAEFRIDLRDEMESRLHAAESVTCCGISQVKLCSRPFDFTSATSKLPRPSNNGKRIFLWLRFLADRLRVTNKISIGSTNRRLM
jgi:hypothetical protein